MANGPGIGPAFAASFIAGATTSTGFDSVHHIGPGSISVTITVGANTTHNHGVHLWIILAALIAMGVVAASVFLCDSFADWLARILGETETTILIRLSAFLLLCVGVQIVWNGIDSLLGSVRLQLR
jgi:multiple antibiotic resistance protein